MAASGGAKSQESKALDSSSGPPWNWFCRLDQRGNDVIDRWHESELSKRARANFERRRDQLGQLDFRYWMPPSAVSVGHHIYVIHFHDEARKQWRVFGHADRANTGFVMTVIAFEKDDVYHPSNASDQAASHRDAICENFRRFAKRCFNTAEH